MGYAERMNPNSEWNRKRNLTSFVKQQVSTPPHLSAKDEPMVMEINSKSVFRLLKDFWCRILSLCRINRPRPISHAQTS